jgi:hypothetical protein
MTEALSKEEAALFELLTLECKVDARGTVRHFNAQGQLHREYGPAIVYADGTRTWYQNGMWHRLDGPAVEFPNGRREWYQKDLLHRLDGPAIEYPDGHREWFQHGRWHRLDGPAIEYPDGRRAWHINGKELTVTEWQQAVADMGCLTELELFEIHHLERRVDEESRYERRTLRPRR